MASTSDQGRAPPPWMRKTARMRNLRKKGPWSRLTGQPPGVCKQLSPRLWRGVLLARDCTICQAAPAKAAASRRRRHSSASSSSSLQAKAHILQPGILSTKESFLRGHPRVSPADAGAGLGWCPKRLRPQPRRPQRRRQAAARRRRGGGRHSSTSSSSSLHFSLQQSASSEERSQLSMVARSEKQDKKCKSWLQYH